MLWIYDHIFSPRWKYVSSFFRKYLIFWEDTSGSSKSQYSYSLHSLCSRERTLVRGSKKNWRTIHWSSSRENPHIRYSWWRYRYSEDPDTNFWYCFYMRWRYPDAPAENRSNTRSWNPFRGKGYRKHFGGSVGSFELLLWKWYGFFPPMTLYPPYQMYLSLECWEMRITGSLENIWKHRRWDIDTCRMRVWNNEKIKFLENLLIALILYNN